MDATFQIDYLTLDRCESTLTRWGVRAETLLERAAPQIVADFHHIEKRRFAKEGPGWAPLAATTAAERSRLGIGGTNPILDRTGASYRGRTGGQLKRSLTETGAKGSVVRMGVDNMFVGTTDPVADFHQYGTKRMPQRKVVDFTEADAERWGIILRRALSRADGTVVAVTGFA